MWHFPCFLFKQQLEIIILFCLIHTHTQNVISFFLSFSFPFASLFLLGDSPFIRAALVAWQLTRHTISHIDHPTNNSPFYVTKHKPASVETLS